MTPWRDRDFKKFMNLRARIALNNIIARWSNEFELTPEEEIELLEKQLATAKEAALVASMDGFSPEER